MDKIAKARREIGQAQAQLMRGKAQISAMKRKGEYLGARVSRELRAKVIARANDKGIPVSILIRNILEEAFADTPPESETHFIKDDHDSVEYPNVIGWEQITLNRSMACTGCSRIIEAGLRVTLGLSSPAEDRVILCSNCKASC